MYVYVKIDNPYHDPIFIYWHVIIHNSTKISYFSKSYIYAVALNQSNYKESNYKESSSTCNFIVWVPTEPDYYNFSTDITIKC